VKVIVRGVSDRDVSEVGEWESDRDISEAGEWELVTLAGWTPLLASAGAELMVKAMPVAAAPKPATAATFWI
jgi:hypothetical protein